VKDWTWQKWVGKLAPIVVALLASAVWEFAELPAPGWASVIAGIITFLAQQAIALFTEAGRRLGQAVASLINVLAPERVIVGGALTSGLLVVLIALVLLSWRWFFVAFHDVFFPPGTWTFDWTDSLIRLFPDRFWFDAGVLLVGGALVVGVLVMVVGWALGRRARG